MHSDDPSRLISHKTIYSAIYAQPKDGLKAEMITASRQQKPLRGLRRTTLAGGFIALESLSISRQMLRISHQRRQRRRNTLGPGP
jgi:hypothetical protein